MPKSRLFVIQEEVKGGHYREVRPFSKLSEAVMHINHRLGVGFKYAAVYYYIAQNGEFYFYHPDTRQEYRLCVREE